MRPLSAALLAVACLVCLSASRCSLPSSPGGGKVISIVSYNVMSLFDAKDDGTEFSEFSVARGRWDEARYRVRLANVAAAVMAAVPPGPGHRGSSPPGPDVLCLEEIENRRVLEDLRLGHLAAAKYRYAAIAPSEGGPFSVCALSRLPILSSSCHSALTPSGRAGRDVLELELDAGGARLVILACHWKSKSEGAEATEEARRLDAALVRGRVAARLARDPGVELVVCGDFNESPDEYLRVGRRYATALMPAGEASPSLGPATDRLLVVSSRLLAARRGSEFALFSPWEESGGYSYSFRGERERIDGFLLAPGLLDACGLSYRGFAAANAAFLLDAEGAPLAWPGSGSSGYSDHLPILLLLDAEAAPR